MKLLSLDTSYKVASAALLTDGVCTLELFADSAQKHAETVLPLIDRLLTETGTARGELDLFAVDVGPGSFTGVRIGASVVNAMAYALDRRVVPVDALFALYATRFGEGEGEKVLAMLDASNGNAYGALYENGRTLLPPDAVEAEPFLRAHGGDALVIGDMTETPVFPTARYVGEAACRMTDRAVEAAMPLYLRPSQAERLHKARMEEQSRA